MRRWSVTPLRVDDTVLRCVNEEIFVHLRDNHAVSFRQHAWTKCLHVADLGGHYHHDTAVDPNSKTLNMPSSRGIDYAWGENNAGHSTYGKWLGRSTYSTMGSSHHRNCYHDEYLT
jgi:hypothetical protein